MLRLNFISALALGALSLAGCSANDFVRQTLPQGNSSGETQRARELNKRQTIWDAFKAGNGDQLVTVNKYIWAASLDVLSFLPIETVDPFTGAITTGFGTAPGSKTAYRATVLIDDPALDARSLKLALNTRSGPVDSATLRAVEDAILTRARQLRTEAARY